ncbi:hypothetical protein EV424DRAFT_1429709 [Suillus variegatus]|nr:hypothetical protein EV424DRAFT_1429709 [Suillus variegatus]
MCRQNWCMLGVYFGLLYFIKVRALSAHPRAQSPSFFGKTLVLRVPFEISNVTVIVSERLPDFARARDHVYRWQLQMLVLC